MTMGPGLAKEPRKGLPAKATMSGMDSRVLRVCFKELGKVAPSTGREHSQPAELEEGPWWREMRLDPVCRDHGFVPAVVRALQCLR